MSGEERWIVGCQVRKEISGKHAGNTCDNRILRTARTTQYTLHDLLAIGLEGFYLEAAKTR